MSSVEHFVRDVAEGTPLVKTRQASVRLEEVHLRCLPFSHKLISVAEIVEFQLKLFILERSSSSLLARLLHLDEKALRIILVRTVHWSLLHQGALASGCHTLVDVLVVVLGLRLLLRTKEYERQGYHCCYNFDKESLLRIHCNNPYGCLMKSHWGEFVI